MAYLVTFNWGWLLAAFLLGLGAGWIAVVQRGDGLSRTAMRWAAAVVAMLLVLALARLVPGRFGYWLDLGLVMLAVYVVGCAVGSSLREWTLSRTAPPA